MVSQELIPQADFWSWGWSLSTVCGIVLFPSGSAQVFDLDAKKEGLRLLSSPKSLGKQLFTGVSQNSNFKGCQAATALAPFVVLRPNIVLAARRVRTIWYAEFSAAS